MTNFFQAPNLKTLSIYRIGLGILTLLNAGLMAQWVNRLYTNQGIVPMSTLTQMGATLDRFSFFYYYDQPWFVWVLFGLFIATGIAILIGYYPNLASFIAWILYASFHNRFPDLGTNGDLVFEYLLLFSVFFPLGSFYNIKKSFQPGGYLAGLVLRIAQLQILTIYIFTAILKLHEPGWYGGTTIFVALNSPNYALWNFFWLHNFPVIIALLTYGVVFTELAFPFLVSFEKTRRPALVIIFLMHIGISLTMNVTYFSEAMYVALLLFVTDKDLVVIKGIFVSAIKRLHKTAIPA